MKAASRVARDDAVRSAMLKALVLLLELAVLVRALAAWGGARWRTATRGLETRLDAVGRAPPGPALADLGELAMLPAPVQRYLRAAMRDGEPIVAAAWLEQAGTFNLADDGNRWKTFTAVERVVTRRPGFIWNACIAMLPGLGVRVHDAYIGGMGLLRADLLGLVPLAGQAGTPGLAQGELMRFLAEAAWYPTALLPGQGVRWEAVDDSSARATLHDGNTEVSLLFRFNGEDLIESVSAEARDRLVDGAVVPMAWEGHWRDYQWRDGLRIPLEGEVAWVLPDGPRPYWRGRVMAVRYERASAPA
jgi:hypothetical protein